MSEEAKAGLQRYLQQGRDALLWKLEGLSDYDVRRPMTPTGTNLLGLVKHVATGELAYFGQVFGRPSPVPLIWFDADADPQADMWATAQESRADVVGLYRAAWSHADETIRQLPLDAPGHVPWWGDAADVTLHRILVHVVSETNRHAGHADVLRELVDGAAGVRAGNSNLPELDAAGWAAYVEHLEQVAREAGQHG